MTIDCSDPAPLQADVWALIMSKPDARSITKKHWLVSFHWIVFCWFVVDEGNLNKRPFSWLGDWCNDVWCMSSPLHLTSAIVICPRPRTGQSAHWVINWVFYVIPSLTAHMVTNIMQTRWQQKIIFSKIFCKTSYYSTYLPRYHHQ